MADDLHDAGMKLFVVAKDGGGGIGRSVIDADDFILTPARSDAWQRKDAVKAALQIGSGVEGGYDERDEHR